jgi:hypothetical protein
MRAITASSAATVGLALVVSSLPWCTLSGAKAQAGEPEFEFSLESCPETVEVTRGEMFRRELALTLVTRNLSEYDPGAQGWSLGITVDGATIVSITTDGTLAASFDDDPPGLRRSGFEHSGLADSERGDPVGDIRGATSAVVLALTEPVTLPPVGASRIARIVIEGEPPAAVGERSALSVYYMNGLSEGSG